jgi:hypothetical protein
MARSAAVPAEDNPPEFADRFSMMKRTEGGP